MARPGHLQGRGGVLNRVVDAPRGEVHVHHTEVVLGLVGRDVAHLAEIPDVEHAGPGPLRPRQFDAPQEVLGLLLLAHPAPDELLRREVLRGCVPAVLVEPDGLVGVAVALHDLPLEEDPREVEHLRIGGIIGGAIEAEGVGREDVKVVLGSCPVHPLQEIEVVHGPPLARLRVRLA